MDDFDQTLRDVTDHLAAYRSGLERSRVAPLATRAEIRDPSEHYGARPQRRRHKSRGHCGTHRSGDTGPHGICGPAIFRLRRRWFPGCCVGGGSVDERVGSGCVQRSAFACVTGVRGRCRRLAEVTHVEHGASQRGRPFDRWEGRVRRTSLRGAVRSQGVLRTGLQGFPMSRSRTTSS